MASRFTVRRYTLSLLGTVAATLLASCESGSGPGGSGGGLVARLVPGRLFYPVGDTARAVLTAGQAGDPPGSVAWRSLNPTVASVDPSGLVTARSLGTAMIEGTSATGTAGVQVLVRGLLHSRAIVADETWLVADTPHVVEGFLSVGSADTAVLTIAPQGRVLFRPKAGLSFGEIHPGRLVIPPGGSSLSLEGDAVAPGSWIGLRFHGPGLTELRNVSMQHCGAAPTFGTMDGCVVASANGSMLAPVMLLDHVTITGARQVGMTLGNFVAFAPGSRNLTIVDGDGHIATISPELAGHLPLGGRFEGNAQNAIWVGTGLVRDSTTWVDAGVPLRLVGQVMVEGPEEPVLTLPAGLVIRSDPLAVITVGKFARGGLVVGDAGGPTVVLEASGAGLGGWGGIEISDGALPSSFARVEMRDCGGSAEACLRVYGGAGSGTRVHVEHVTIRGARSIGVQLWALARFDATSTNLTVTESVDAPVELPADAVASLPPGQYDQNGTDGIRLRWGDVTSSATWRNQGVPYLAPVGLAIASPGDPTVLTLEPGVVVRMGPDTRVVIGDRSALYAIGTAADSITFASTTPGVAGSWIGVELGHLADPGTRLQYVQIQDAGAGEPGEPGAAAALRFQHDPGGVLRNSTIARSPNCGLVLFGGNDWADDYSAPTLGNAFVEVAGPLLCRPTS